MKLFTCIKAVTLLAATGLAACTNPPAEQAGQAEKMGPSVVSYDHGALDTLVALGQQAGGSGVGFAGCREPQGARYGCPEVAAT